MVINLLEEWEKNRKRLSYLLVTLLRLFFPHEKFNRTLCTLCLAWLINFVLFCLRCFKAFSTLFLNLKSFPSPYIYFFLVLWTCYAFSWFMISTSSTKLFMNTRTPCSKCVLRSIITLIIFCPVWHRYNVQYINPDEKCWYIGSNFCPIT